MLLYHENDDCNSTIDAVTDWMNNVNKDVENTLFTGVFATSSQK